MRRQTLPFEIVECGIDWLTTTATDKRTAMLLLHRAAAIQREEERRGFFVKAWRQSGYAGWACGRVQHGERQDGAIVRLSSDLASEYWWDCYQITERCTRLDWQVTGRTHGPVNRFLKTLRAGFRQHYKSHSRPVRTRVISDDGGGFTLYLGQRTSDVFFRGYNKGIESGEERYQGCARLELELKGDACKSAIAWTLAGSSVSEQVCAGIKGFLADRGISGFSTFRNPHSFYECSKPASDVVRTLQWLTVSVGPSVRNLIQLGHSASVADALGLVGPIQLKGE